MVHDAAAGPSYIPDKLVSLGLREFGRGCRWGNGSYRTGEFFHPCDFFIAAAINIRFGNDDDEYIGLTQRLHIYRWLSLRGGVQAE
ncbi:hypothetical protein J31TS3_02880 [Paenibacillus lactis]|nr:hypothetical protein J31TS3_02880 [Paenibacillus lactis]